MKEIKINLSNGTVIRKGTLESLNSKSYSCKNITTCGNTDCEDCIFGKDDIFTLEQIKKRLIK